MLIASDVDDVLQEALALVDVGVANSFVAKPFVERYNCTTRTIAPLRVHCAAGPVHALQRTAGWQWPLFPAGFLPEISG